MSSVLNLTEQRFSRPPVAERRLIVHDDLSRALVCQAERVARSDATVLVIGETGTGKELIARHVHDSSGRLGPFGAVNCGAFSENLIDAELFGHEAGAYTGAGQARSGWFEAAQRGTLFLDEIGDLSLALQVKLLRVLQERQVVRLGSRKAIDIDVRLVAATHVDLVQAVEEGRFRRDLYYRLNIAMLRVPALAERPADIVALAEHFMAVYGEKLRRPAARLSEAARAALLNYRWPGNIRELENVIHSALIFTQGDEIEVQALNLPDVALAANAAPPAAATQASGAFDLPCMELLRRGLRGLFEMGGRDLYAAIERDTVQAAYEFCHRNQVHTAELLGISRNVLRAQLKRFGLLPDRGRADAVRPHSVHFNTPSTAVHDTLGDAMDDDLGATSWAA